MDVIGSFSKGECFVCKETTSSLYKEKQQPCFGSYFFTYDEVAVCTECRRQHCYYPADNVFAERVDPALLIPCQRCIIFGYPPKPVQNQAHKREVIQHRLRSHGHTKDDERWDHMADQEDEYYYSKLLEWESNLGRCEQCRHASYNAQGERVKDTSNNVILL
jgi:hypothetical protein